MAEATPETIEVDRQKWAALVAFYDKHVGTPCAEIRWHDREIELLRHVAGNGSMREDRIDEMTPEAMRDLLKYLARDGRKLAGYETAEECHGWVMDVAEGRV